MLKYRYILMFDVKEQGFLSIFSQGFLKISHTIRIIEKNCVFRRSFMPGDLIIGQDFLSFPSPLIMAARILF